MRRLVLGVGLVVAAAVGVWWGYWATSHTSVSEGLPSVRPAATGIPFTREDAERLEALIDENPEESIRLLEQIVAASVTSLSDEQFDGLRVAMTKLVDQKRLRKLVRAGREYPATTEQVALLIDDLEKWDAAIIRGADHWDGGYIQ